MARTNNNDKSTDFGRKVQFYKNQQNEKRAVSGTGYRKNNFGLNKSSEFNVKNKTRNQPWNTNAAISQLRQSSQNSSINDDLNQVSDYMKFEHRGQTLGDLFQDQPDQFPITSPGINKHLSKNEKKFVKQFTKMEQSR